LLRVEITAAAAALALVTTSTVCRAAVDSFAVC
jgi:hypothetical protein